MLRIGDTYYVYIWALVESYYVQDKELVSNSGSSMAYRFIIKDNKVVDYEYPKDGSDYSSSLKRLFPISIRLKISYTDDLVDSNKIKHEVNNHYAYLKK